MIRRAILLLVFACLSPAADRPLFIYSATFAWYDHPRDLWPAHLTRLKSMGFNTIFLPLPSDHDTPHLIEAVRLARQLGLRVWLGSETAPSEVEALTVSRGGPILENIARKSVAWFPAGIPRRFLNPADLASLRSLSPKHVPAAISVFDAGWPIGDDIRALRSDPSNYLLASRELLAAGVKALNCSAVLEGRALPEREPALDLAGKPRPQAAVLSRNGALIAHLGPLLAAMHPSAAPSPHLVLAPKEKAPALLRLALLDSSAPRGPAFVSALNYGEDRPISGVLAARDPKTGKQLVLRGLNLPPRQALLMPINLHLSQPEVCTTCSSFAPDERLVWATSELLSVDFENGVLALEFVAPAEGELELELARRPQGPLIAGARIRQFNWDDATHRLSLRIPAGQSPDFHTRVGLALEAPETSAFLKTPRRFILGSTALVTASFSSPELAARSRLLAPPGWRVRPPSDSSQEMEYSLDVPSDAIAGDTVTVAIESDGKVAQSATVPLAPFCSVRVEPEEVLHPDRDARFPIRPHLGTLALPGHRSYRVYITNSYDEIRTFDLAASGAGLRISPAREQVSIGARLEREVTLDVALDDPRSGLYRWNLEIREGPRKMEVPLVLAAIAANQALAYEFDLDRDGFPELVLENQHVRVAFSPRFGGRCTEFLLKQHRLNAFTLRGALQESTPLEGRIVGPGQIELRSAHMTRRISLGPRDNSFEVEQTGGSSDWLLSTHGLPQFTIQAPGAQVETDRQPFSTQFRLKFPEATPRRARFSLTPPPKSDAASTEPRP